MNTIVIYDSVFGNTEKIAQLHRGDAWRAGCSRRSNGGFQTNCAVFDLLVVGSPTRGFRPTEGISEIPQWPAQKSISTGVRVAAFDTRIVLETIDSKALRFLVDKGGYAASTIAKTLEKKGGKLAGSAPPEGFFVTGEQGPLKDGELERAAGWAGRLQPE
jgi:flavodoxin